ncbi:MAG: DUF6145 family protein [Lachnospiraceae bacterium]|nr:DUF6145 family protein [Lachnospiraceae bacterium]
MYYDEVVLCGASSYTMKYFLNDDFKGLPDSIKDELKIMCVLFTEDVGGTIQLKFDEDGSLLIETDSNEEDILYDEIGSVLKVKQIQAQKAELLESLEQYYKVFFLGENLSC